VESGAHSGDRTRSGLQAPSLEDALELALSSRPELAESNISLAINKIDTRYYKDQSKPQVDAYATVTASGLAGTQQTAIQFGTSLSARCRRC